MELAVVSIRNRPPSTSVEGLESSALPWIKGLVPGSTPLFNPSPESLWGERGGGEPLEALRGVNIRPIELFVTEACQIQYYD
jgi:hypothetical protein